MTDLPFVGHVIDGAEVPSRSGATFDSVNPATQQAWARVARGGADDAAAAVAAARRAFDEGPWPRMTPDERGRILHRLAVLLEADADELGRLDTVDMGKPITQSRDVDVPRSALNLRFFADYARLATDDALPSPSGHHVYTRHEPVGVAAAISPWNFPLMQASWKIAPALAFGNAVVLKPAEQAPASCTRLGLLALEAGMPPGVLTVLQGFGPGEAGQALAEHPDVDLVTFTGESATGRRILAAGAPSLKRVSFELGGKGANLVFADADLDRAVEWSLKAIFLNGGQVCLSGSRLYVQRPVYDEFLARFAAGADAMHLGDPLDEATEIGPLSSEDHWRKVTGYLDIAAEEGAKVRPAAAARAGRCDRRCWSTSPSRCACAARKSSGPSWWCSRSRPRTRECRWPTTPRTGSTRWCSPRTCGEGIGSPPGCGPAPSGSTASSSATSGHRSAATRTRASAGKAAGTPASSSPSPRPS